MGFTTAAGLAEGRDLGRVMGVRQVDRHGAAMSDLGCCHDTINTDWTTVCQLGQAWHQDTFRHKQKRTMHALAGKDDKDIIDDRDGRLVSTRVGCPESLLLMAMPSFRT
jgi:hypothetical protein